MKRSNLIQQTDAIMYVVLFGAILSVCLILFYFGGPLIPHIAIPFIAIAGATSSVLFTYNIGVLIHIYRNNKNEEN